MIDPRIADSISEITVKISHRKVASVAAITGKNNIRHNRHRMIPNDLAAYVNVSDYQDVEKCLINQYLS